MKKDLDLSQQKNKINNNTMKILNSRIKALESVVMKQNAIIEEKDYLIDAASSAKDKLQKRMFQE